jgi:hypothetical protein
MALQIWTGRVEASQEVPVNTNLNFRQGAHVTIVSTGFARFGDDQRLEGPSGRFEFHRSDAPAPEENIGALLAKTGRVFTAIAGGLLNWAPPTDDNVEFVYNDRRGTYGNNAGGFDVTMQYDDQELAR